MILLRLIQEAKTRPRDELIGKLNQDIFGSLYKLIPGELRVRTSLGIDNLKKASLERARNILFSTSQEEPISFRTFRNEQPVPAIR